MTSAAPAADRDAELLAQALAGGPDRRAAWDELTSRHSARLYAVARALGMSSTDAADVVQTAWLRLLERGHQVRDGGQVGAWLAMVVRNEARRLHTRRRLVPTDQAWDQVADPSTSAPEERLVRSERAVALRTAFARLGAECAELLRLLSTDPPLSYAEVSAVVGRPIGSLGPTRQRCLDQLRRHLPAGL